MRETLFGSSVRITELTIKLSPMYSLLHYSEVSGSERIYFAGDEDDSVHAELETKRDGSLAGNMRH